MTPGLASKQQHLLLPRGSRAGWQDAHPYRPSEGTRRGHKACEGQGTWSLAISPLCQVYLKAQSMKEWSGSNSGFISCSGYKSPSAKLSPFPWSFIISLSTQHKQLNSHLKTCTTEKLKTVLKTAPLPWAAPSGPKAPADTMLTHSNLFPSAPCSGTTPRVLPSSSAARQIFL